MCTVDNTMCVHRSSTIVVLFGEEKLCILVHTERGVIGSWYGSFVGKGVSRPETFSAGRVLSPYLPHNFVWS